MPRLPQLPPPNGFLAQKSVFEKHLMEQIINLFGYTSNLISGASPPGQAAVRLSLARHSPGESIVSGARGPAWGRSGVCPKPTTRPAWPKSHREKNESHKGHKGLPDASWFSIVPALGTAPVAKKMLRNE